MNRYLLAFFLSAFILFVSCTKEKDAGNQRPTPLPSQETSKADVKKDVKKESLIQQKPSESTAQQWQKYNAIRGKAKKADRDKEWEKSAQFYLQAGDYAMQLERPGIASWQYNSAGKTLIDGFKSRVQYDTVMKKMREAQGVKVRAKVRKMMKKTFLKESLFLKPAQSYLLRAVDADSQHPKRKGNKGKRLSLIKSNLSFVEWIDKFTTEKSSR